MSAEHSLPLVLWTAFAALVAPALWILLAACGLAWPGGRPVLVFCPADVAARPLDPALAAEQERQRSLHGSIRDLEIALLDRPYCTPSTQAQAEQEPEAPSLEDAIREGDEQALAGCWVLSSDYTLYDIRTGEPRSVRHWEVCFGDDGGGDQDLAVVGGTECNGRVNATFPEGATLEIRDVGDMRCRGGNWSFVRARVITCTLGGDGTAQCLTRDVATPDAASAVTMRRRG